MSQEMQPEMTRMQRRQYLKDPSRCLYCRSGSIHQGTAYEFETYDLKQPVECLDCGRKWEDTYELKNVEEI